MYNPSGTSEAYIRSGPPESMGRTAALFVILRYRRLRSQASIRWAISEVRTMSATQATVARIERVEIETRMTTLRKLTRGLGVDPAELVE